MAGHQSHRKLLRKVRNRLRTSLRKARDRLRTSLQKTHKVPAASLRRARRLLPYPRAWAAISYTRSPNASITGKHTALIRPEGMDFTPFGDLMAVSNSDGNTVNVYVRKDGRKGIYRGKPSCTLAHSINLRFVHDVAFSPCGTMLAAVARDAHSVSIFMRSESEPNTFEANAACIIGGPASGLCFPTGVRFHPNGECLAVTNRQNSGILLFRIGHEPDGYAFDIEPYQMISEKELLAHGLAAPHCLAFSPDGALLFVTHKRFYVTRNPGGQSALTCFRWCTPQQLEPAPIFTSLRGANQLHSIAVHPSGRFLAVTDEHAGVELFGWDTQRKSAKKIDKFSIFRGGHLEGPKGIAFTSDGKQLAVTTACDEVLYFSNWNRKRATIGSTTSH